MGHRDLLAFTKWGTITGAFLTMFPIGLPMYWGNMSVYVFSYYLIRRESETGVQAQWIISLYFSCEAAGIFLVGLLSKRVGKRIGLSCGMVLFLGGIFGTYFALKSSIIVMNVTLGVLSGLGDGFVIGMSLEYAVPWAGKHVGLVTALIQNGYNFGPLVMNMFITKYTNPDNKSPDFDFGPSFYFSQGDILDNVSHLFIVLGCFCLGVQLVGFLMVREFKTCSSETVSINHTSSDQSVEQRENGIGGDTTPNIPPLQILKTRSFYALWFVSLFYSNSLVIILTYYKSFGQLWIHDDHFLAWVGTAFTISTLAFSPLWGAATDRVGVKMTLTLMYALSAVHMFLLYFAPRQGKWLYLIAMVLYGSSSACVFPTLMTATCKLYGQTHHSSNFGLVDSSDILMAFVTPTAMELMLLHYGWFHLMCLGACLNIAGVLLIIFGLPKC